MGDRAPHGQSWSELAFIVGVVIAAIGLIIVSVVLGVAPGVDPEQALSIFAAP
jgi:hypothetical protein